MCSWDEKASVKIQKHLEQEILAFIADANKVHTCTVCLLEPLRVLHPTLLNNILLHGLQ